MELGLHGLGLGEKHDTRGLKIQSVNGEETATSPLQTSQKAVLVPMLMTWNSKDAGEFFHRHQMLVFKEDREIFSHPAKQRAQQRLATLFASFVKVTGLSLGGGFAVPEFCPSDGLESVLIGVMEELRRTAIARPSGRTRGEKRCERPGLMRPHFVIKCIVHLFLKRPG